MTEQRVVLVTGAARGIGLGIAERLVREGWRVIAADIHAQAGRAAAATLGAAAVFAELDVSDEASVKASIEAVMAAHAA